MSERERDSKASDQGFASLLERFEPVIGLEVHCQLKTNSKLFCACPIQFGAMANAQTCPVCLGLPGVLPKLNQKAVDFAIKMALSVGAKIRAKSVFSRKQYFYPDLPKGYQITQYDLPYCENGSITLDSGLRITIQRIHLEEDAGKNIHGDSASYVDLNRAGVALLEIVSAPELHSPADAAEYLRKLRAITRFIDISDGNLEEGSFRCDANISLRPRGAKELGTRTEIKNLNSFRNVEKAISYEILRQADALEAGERIQQLTLGFDAASGRTYTMRSKEDSPDYRYFPDPDIGTLWISPERIAHLAQNIEELPEQKKQRYQIQLEISESDAMLLTEEKEIANYFEHLIAELTGRVAPKIAANWLISEYFREAKQRQMDWSKPLMSAPSLAGLLALLGAGTISGKIAKAVFEEMLQTGQEAQVIIEAKGLVQISDKEAIEILVSAVLNEYPEQLAQYRAGKEKVFGFFAGQIMKRAQGRLNPNMLNECLKEHLHGKS